MQRHARVSSMADVRYPVASEQYDRFLRGRAPSHGKEARMERFRITLIGATVALSCVLVEPSVWAQQASGIAGVVRDTSGAVIPGVTVEAASPALIEKVRTVVTDGDGRDNIVDLRPGTESGDFTLTGVCSFRREGLEITA